ncbi:hypothetical protein ACTQWG_15785 [Blautia sp. HCP3S3_H10_1]|uniref:hypothetical protein n=1 Tax=unclassified Blautia TaxID=2648079 RepID=UPI003F9134D6|nr:hypothetical protein [Clostridia bacterium]
MKKKTRILILGIALVLTMAMSGCGVNHKSPEGVVEALIKNYVSGSEKNVKKCYSQNKDTNELLQSEIDATLKYFAAHKPGKVKVEQCDKLSENGDYTYVYIIYNLVLENSQEYPCVGTYMVEKNSGKYYVMSPSEITDELRNQAATDYAKFMTTDSYKSYTKAYNVFIKKNPGYEEKIANKLNAE